MRHIRQGLPQTAVFWAAIACFAGAAGGARAQEHPIYLPTRDVAVTYQLTGGPGGPPMQTHLFFSAAANKLRIDTPGGAGYTVLDRAGGQRLLVMNQEQAYSAIPLDPSMADGFVLNSHMSYTRAGTDTVAGVPCVNWTVSSSQSSGSACVTEDGVLLRGSGKGPDGSETGLVAVSVQYAPQPAGLFLPPAGFHAVDPAQMQGPGGPDQGPPGAGPQGGGPQGGPPPGEMPGGPQTGGPGQ